MNPVLLQGQYSWAKLYCGDCMELMPIEADAVISDPPFSERTHSGHDAVTKSGVELPDGNVRESLGYKAWYDDDVANLTEKLPKKGWVCIFTDHVLAPVWLHKLAWHGRYTFAPIPVFVRGRSVRLSGDGPSSWTDWLCVARTSAEHKWGTLPGLYEGNRGSIEHMGGKPINVMCNIVDDYSKPGDAVLDFCMGSGTTGVACVRTGRNFIGIEKDPSYFQISVDRIQRELDQGRLFAPVSETKKDEQAKLFA